MFQNMKLLVGIMFFLAGSCHSLPAKSSEKDPRILILGAGMAGITVAKTLDENGFKNLLVIEGTSKMGGRMNSIPFSDHTIDLGAMWVYGKGSNPVYLMLKEYNITVIDDPDTWTVRDVSGNDVTSMADDAERRFIKALKSSEADAKDARNRNLADFTVSSSLRNHDWRPANAVEDSIEFMYIDWEFTNAPPLISGKHLHFYAPPEEFKSKKSLVVNDDGGFQSLVEKMAETFMTSASRRIVYNKQVTRIKQDDDGVVVTTLDGSRYNGDYVVTTFSLGVMQSRQVTFKPEFPKCKQVAVDKFGAGAATIIYMEFPTTFWDDSFYLMYTSEDRGKYAFYQNLNIMKPQSNILRLGLVGAANSRRIQNLSDKGLVKDILRYLRKMYPNATIPFPTNYKVQKWGSEPLFLSAWSYWPPAFTEANMADMQAPFGKVYFAGEYLHSVHYGYVHGAYMSGNKTAYDLMECLTNSGTCPKSADLDFDCSTLDRQSFSTDEGPRFG